MIRNLSKNIALPFKYDETIHKSSMAILITEELDVLKHGLKCQIHPLPVNKTDGLGAIDFIYRIMTKDLKN